MKQRKGRAATARGRAATAIARLVRMYPDLQPIEPDTTGLDQRDARLAVAIYRATVRRWLTLVWLLNRQMPKPRRLEKAEPLLQGLLLTGAAQLLFMDRLPAHAVVDESVDLAKRLLRPAAGAVVNAVLRKLAELIESRDPTGGFTPAPHRLPWHPGGGQIQLRQAVLPALKTREDYWSVATSHPRQLVRRWLELFGEARAAELLMHSLKEAPTIICASGGLPTGEPVKPHERDGFYLWRGESGDLARFLEKHQAWVQDPASHRVIAATADLRPARIIDLCAGRGTKTLQLARLHPAAAILASDPDPVRFADLSARFAGSPNVTVVPDVELEQHAPVAGAADLIVLDVPCSNTGVLARRLEARYRYGRESIESLVDLQRSILDRAARLLRPGGRILYATCSIDPAENGEQAGYLAEHHPLALRHEELLLPGGEGPTYHDGGYYALLS